METEKKKSGKFKKIVIVIVVVVVLLYIIGKAGGDDGEEASSSEAGGTTQTEATAQDSQETGQSGENASDNENSDSASVSEKSDSRYQVGETVTLKSSDGGKFVVTITDWGTTEDYSGNTVLYIKYKIANVGEETVSVGNTLFDVYADNYYIDNTVVPDANSVGDSAYGDLTAGRKIEGVLYSDINPEDASVIEVECGQAAVFVLKDDSKE
jgi:hypothetical protein